MATNRWRALGLIAGTAAILSLSHPATASAASVTVRPQAQWVIDGQVGIFYHWGLDAFPHYTDVRAWEQHLKSAGWSPKGMVSAAQRVNARYIIFATFHSRVGYVKVWPSKVPGSASTERDFLGELIDAAAAQGIKVIVYVTDDPAHWNEGSEWLAPQMRDEIGFGKYSVAVMDELMANYPKLGGFWWDGWNDYWTQIDLDRYVKGKRPELVTFRNHNGAAADVDQVPTKMDIISQEDFRRVWDPTWDYASGAYIPLPRATEAIFRVGGHWWYQGGNPPLDYEEAIKRWVTAIGSSMVATISIGPKDTGDFSDNIEGFLDYFKTWLAPRTESLLGTEGGGYVQDSLQPENWTGGAYGVVTVKKGDPNVQFVHVLRDPAKGRELKLRDSGFKVAKVEDLVSGRELTFSQKDGSLSFDVPQGYPYDTVLKVTTQGRQGLLPRASIKASASSEAKPAANLVDADYASYFESGELPVDVTLDLGAAKDVAYLMIKQREDSPIPDNDPRKYYSSRIQNYEIYASNDPKAWGSALKTGSMTNQRGVQAVDVGAASSRYLRLRILDNHSHGKTTSVRVAELDAATAYVAGAPAASPSRPNNP